MISIENLTFAYPGNDSIFEEFTIDINQGESWSVIGPSGCGKSTLLFLIAGLKICKNGIINVGNKVISRPRPETGLVLQDHGLLPWETVRENVRLGWKIREFYGPDGKHAPAGQKLSIEEADEKIDYWLDWLGIRDHEFKLPSQLSRGQRQRVAIARTLSLDPDVLLMDEPFSALDAPIREELQKVMIDFHSETDLTSITVTHDIEEAVILGKKILALSAGCNKKPCVIENETYGLDDVRKKTAFHNKCNELRNILAGINEGI